jgi:alpha-1,2-mannosyltransferase
MFMDDGSRASYAMSAGELALHGGDVQFVRLPAWVSTVVSVALFAFLPAFLTARLMFQHGFGWDFRAFYAGASAYLHGVSPYPQDSLAALADKQGFVYPAPTALLLAPLALLPYTAALVLWTVGSVAAIALSLLVCGVRDWRCFGALMLTLPAEHSLRLGTLGPLLLLLLALLWRYRDRVVMAAVLVSVIALSKLFLAPLLLWFVFTRRLRTAALAALLVAVMCVIAWLPLGETTILAYPSLLHTLAGYEQTFSYSLTSLLVDIGVGSATASGLACAAGAAVLCVAYARRSDDGLVFRLALAASFLLSPIVWGHYFLLLAVPLALRRPRLEPAWVLAMWIRSDTLNLRDAPIWVALALVVMAVQLGLLAPARGWRWLVPPRARLVLMLAVLAALQLASLSSAEAGYTRSAALAPSAGGRGASGAASLRIERRQHRVCWRVWTQALPSRRALVAVEPRIAAGEYFVFQTLIANGQANGCAVLPYADRRLLRALIGAPGRYRLLVAVPGRAVIAGTLGGE